MSDEMEIDSADWQVPNTLNITPGGPASSAVAGSSNAAPAAASSSSTTTNNTNNAAGPSTSSAAAAVQPPVTTPVAKTTPMDSVLANLGTPSTGASVLAPTTIVPSVTVSLHPLVILHLSEHWTRIRAQEGQKQQVIGALIGKQNGRNIEVMNAFELKFDRIQEDIIINQEYYATKEAQYKQVFSDLDFLGWYTTGEAPTDQDIKVHKQICLINECPIMLQLNPQPRNTDKLPVSLYESLIDLVHGEPQMLFVPLTYTLATEEAERIGVDHVVRMSNSEVGDRSVVAENLAAQYSAIKMLHSRVQLVLAYIRDVEAGKLEQNHEIMREVYALTSRLPVVDGTAFRDEYFTQSNDVGLITYLGILTKGCNMMNNLVNKFNVLYDRQGMSRRMRGIFF